MSQLHTSDRFRHLQLEERDAQWVFVWSNLEMDQAL